ncbi:hypothetical protein HY632_03505 [Candidatus Uhrbacteria bacterium]|nr:hypothetical protein [Candidatus Uhrbacteria bacterium]
MPDAIALWGSDAHHTTHRIITIALRAFQPNPALFIAVLHRETAPDSGSHTTTHHRIAMVMENIALGLDERSTPAEWFTAFATRLHEELRTLPTLPPLPSAWCGIAVDQGTHTAVTFAASGGMTVRVLTSDARTFQVALISEPSTGRTSDLLQFDHAVDGILREQDLLLLTGPSGTSAFPEGTLRPMFAHRTIRDGIDALRRHAEGIHTPLGALALVHGSPPPPPPRSHASMESFLQTAASTERFLTPRLGPAFREYFTETRDALAALVRRSPRRHRTTRTTPAEQRSTTALRLAVRTIRLTLRSATAMLLDACRLLGVLLVRGTTLLVRGSMRIARIDRGAFIASCAPAAVTARAQAQTQRLRERYHALPRSSRVLLLLALVFATLFGGSTVALWRRRAVEQEVASYNATLASIDELRSTAEARLLFGDRTTARASLHDAIGLLATVPTSTRARRERAATLDRELRAALDRARLLVHIAHPLTVYPNATDSPMGSLADIALLKQQLVIVPTHGERFALLDARTNTSTLRPITPKLTVVPFRALAMDDRSFLLLDRNAHGAVVDSQTGTATPATIEQSPAVIQDAMIVRGRLYLLQEDGAITRHARTAAGFGRGSIVIPRTPTTAPAHRSRMWITKTITAIGSTDGTLAIYVNGRRKDVPLTSDIDPPIRQEPLLTASADGNTIYIGDSHNGRIAAVSLVGELLHQIQSDAFRNIQRILPNPSGDALYVLHDGIVSVVVPPKPSESR